MDADRLRLRRLGDRSDETDDVGVRARPCERHEDTLRLHECGSLLPWQQTAGPPGPRTTRARLRGAQRAEQQTAAAKQRGLTSAQVGGVLEVIGHVDDDGVRTEEQVCLETERRLAVQQPLPPVAR